MTKEQFSTFVTRVGITGPKIDADQALYLWGRFKTTDSDVWDRAVNNLFSGEVVPRNIEGAMVARIAEVLRAKRPTTRYPEVPEAHRKNNHLYAKLIIESISKHIKINWDEINSAVASGDQVEVARLLSRGIKKCTELCPS